MQKGDIAEIRITDLTDEGFGVGRAGSFPLFVKDSIPGDVLKVEVLKDKKTYGYARILEILTPSEDRIKPLCENARACGGCQLQAMKYEAELRFKENRVRNVLTRIGGINFENSDVEFRKIIGMENPTHYRNKAEYPVRKNKNGEIVMGFYAGRTHSVIDCKDCLIGQEDDREVLDAVKEWMAENNIAAYDEEPGSGIVRHILIRTSYDSKKKMVCLIVNRKKLPCEKELAEKLSRNEKVASLSYNVNTKNTNVIMGEQLRGIFGPMYLEDRIGEMKYRISPKAFYQVNPVQTKVLYETALEFAGLSGNETVWDLYCGIGTISLFLAKKAKKVYGVEIIEEAIRDANENKRINGIENAEFFVGKSEEVLPRHFQKTGETADVIVVDPPRKGCDEKLLQTILKMKPEKVVYVSCNPATLARDIRILTEGDGETRYELKKVQPTDCFGRTVHVECVVLMSKN